MAADTCQIVLTHCASLNDAQAIATALVTEGHAAAVNVLPQGKSTYIWRGKLQTVDEHLVIIKAKTAKYSAIQQRIKALHPYELPAIVAVPIVAGLPEYLEWLACSN